MNKVELPYMTIEYIEPVVYNRYTKDVVLDAEKVRDIGDAVERVSQGKYFLLLSDIRKQIDIPPEAHKIIKEELPKRKIIANAVVVRWLAQRLITNVYSLLVKPKHPLKVFTDEQEAMKWLLAHKP